LAWPIDAVILTTLTAPRIVPSVRNLVNLMMFISAVRDLDDVVKSLNVGGREGQGVVRQQEEKR
jgi:hypothetical protein